MNKLNKISNVKNFIKAINYIKVINKAKNL